MSETVSSDSTSPPQTDVDVDPTANTDFPATSPQGRPSIGVVREGAEL
jgi:hypothetical protein